MRARLVSVAFLLLTVIIPVCGDDIKTLDGKTYYNVNVISKTVTAMTVEYAKTSDSKDRIITTIKTSRLDETARKKYGFNSANPAQSDQEIIQPVNNSPAGKTNVEASKKNTGFDVPQGASAQQYLIQKTKLSKIQDSMNARYQAEMKEMDESTN